MQPLEPGLRLADVAPTRDVPPADHGTYPITLPGAGCFVVTVGWNGDNRTGQFTGLAETHRSLCNDN